MAFLMEVGKMRMVRVAMMLALVPLGVLGCNRAPELDVRTFNLENRSGYEAAELVDPYIYGDREGAPGAISALSNAISVRETTDNLDKIARVLAEFDQPIPPVRLRFQLIEADSFQDEDPAIAEVVTELRSLFRFEGYRLMGEAVVTLAGGGMDSQDIEQRFLGTDDPFVVMADAVIERPGTVRLRPVYLWDEETGDNILQTHVSVSLGQTVVIGGGRGRAGGRTFILTVKAES
jgi:hypothetical protein